MMDIADDNEDVLVNDAIQNETPLSFPQQQLATLYSERYGIHIHKYYARYKIRVANLSKINPYYNKSKRKESPVYLPADTWYLNPQVALTDLKFIAAALLEGYDLDKITKDKFEGLYDEAILIESSLLAAATTNTASSSAGSNNNNYNNNNNNNVYTDNGITPIYAAAAMDHHPSAATTAVAASSSAAASAIDQVVDALLQHRATTTASAFASASAATTTTARATTTTNAPGITAVPLITEAVFKNSHDTYIRRKMTDFQKLDPALQLCKHQELLLTERRLHNRITKLELEKKKLNDIVGEQESFKKLTAEKKKELQRIQNSIKYETKKHILYLKKDVEQGLVFIEEMNNIDLKAVEADIKKLYLHGKKAKKETVQFYDLVGNLDFKLRNRGDNSASKRQSSQILRSWEKYIL